MTAALHVTLAEHIGPDVERQVQALTNELLLVTATAFTVAVAEALRPLIEFARAAIETFTKAFAAVDTQDDYMLVPPSCAARQGSTTR